MISLTARQRTRMTTPILRGARAPTSWRTTPKQCLVTRRSPHRMLTRQPYQSLPLSNTTTTTTTTTTNFTICTYNSWRRVGKRHKATLADQMAAKSSSGFVSAARANKHPWMEALETFLRKTRTIPIPRWITPRHYTITFSEVLGHSSFLLVAISYAVDDFLLLRCIAVAGSTAMLFFTYYQ